MTTGFPDIAFLGAGSMAGALISGIQSSSMTINEIRTTNRSIVTAERFSTVTGVVAYATENDQTGEPTANQLAVSGVRVVVIAVKPVQVAALLSEIAGSLQPGTLVISLAAGIPLAVYEEILPETVAVIRAMPNMPVLVRKGITGLAVGKGLSEHNLALAVELFKTVGQVLVVPEIQIDALATISGSGPAYVYLLVEALTSAGMNKGFTTEQAALLATETFTGATALLDWSEAGPAELRQRVTSPNGITERAVAVLQEADLVGIFDRATDAALVRARELAEGS